MVEGREMSVVRYLKQMCPIIIQGKTTNVGKNWQKILVDGTMQNANSATFKWKAQNPTNRLEEEF